jgi:hypothetical protein
MIPASVLYDGKDGPPPERTPLRAGPLSLLYQAGDLRYIRLGEQEILRRVYVAVRDRHWSTVPATLSSVRIEVASDAFHITCDAEHVEGDIDFCWKGTIRGDAQGTIAFAVDGVARSTFLRNRIGFCVLHPMYECAGQPCAVEKVDGTVERGRFPRYILPYQPFQDMRAIAHPILPGLWAEVRFAGEVFEMEDQRNWTDASFKTYCTPLALPFPVRVEAGTRIGQSITLTLADRVHARLEGTQESNVKRQASNVKRVPCSVFRVPLTPMCDTHHAPRITHHVSRLTPPVSCLPPHASTLPTRLAERESSALTFEVGASPGGPLPRIGLGVASGGQALGGRALARLKALHLAHLRVDLDLSRAGYDVALAQAAEEAGALGIPLEIALHLSAASEELAALRALLEQVRPLVCAWLIFGTGARTTPRRLAELARSYLAGYDPAARIGGGTNAYFAQLNRQRPPIDVLDLVCYSINPQVHAFDNASLAETLETQALIVQSARRFAGDKPLAVTPVTLKPRFNPSATGPEPAPAPGSLPAQVDVRQMSLFGAGWTAGSLKYLSEGGVYSATYYETNGWRGVMETESGSPLPGVFRSLPGSAFPLYHVLADVGDMAGGKVVPARSSDPLRVDGLAMCRDGRVRMVLANLTAEPQRAVVRNLGQRVRVRALDERNVEEAMRTPGRFRAREGERLQTAGGALACTLLPYAILRMDGVQR